MRSPVRRLIPTLGIVVSIVISGCLPASGAHPTAPSRPSAQNVSRDWTGRLPLYFVENGGQVDAQVQYTVRAGPLTAYFAPGGVTYALVSGGAGSAEVSGERFGRPDDFPPVLLGAKANGADAEGTRDAQQRWAIRMELLGGDRAASPVGQDPTEARFNYFHGPEETWKTDLRSYAGVTYADVWPGVALVYGQQDRRLKYSFVVQPGASPEQIRFAYQGATSRLNEVGQLVVETPIGGFVDECPVAYQEVDGSKVAVNAAFRHDPYAPADGGAYGFEVGTYDPSLPLVLDPMVTAYAGYIGGDLTDDVSGVAIDGQGYAYVTGAVTSSQATFPQQVGPDLTANGAGDAFVAKVSPTGDALVYIGYIGGSEGESGRSIALSPNCNSSCQAYITGFTRSDPATFPAKKPWPSTYGGGADAFVARVSATGSSLVYAGYVGGADTDIPSEIAVDGIGNVYIVGYTQSDQTTFPVAGNQSLATYKGGATDGFVCKVNPPATAFTYCGFFGGSGIDFLNGLAVDRSGSVYLAGLTSSTPGDGFPLQAGPDLTFNGEYDAFVAKLSANGVLVYSGYIGGFFRDGASDVAVRPDCISSCQAFVVGGTASANFPTTAAWVQQKQKKFNAGGADAFVARVSASGAGLEYSGFVGGSASDSGGAIAVDEAGYVTLVGTTESTELTFPVKSGPNLSHSGKTDAFVARINPGGTDLVFAGYVGGTDYDHGQGLAAEAGMYGAAYITMSAASNQQQEGLPVAVGPDLSYNGGESDGLVTKVHWANMVPPQPWPTPTPAR